jgi:hypothetical protein
LSAELLRGGIGGGPHWKDAPARWIAWGKRRAGRSTAAGERAAAELDYGERRCRMRAMKRDYIDAKFEVVRPPTTRPFNMRPANWHRWGAFTRWFYMLSVLALMAGISKLAQGAVEVIVSLHR